MFRKVLVANRGEIAVRIIRALREAGIASVAVYSDADRASLAVQMAGEAVYLGPAPASESYLRIDRILEAARSRGVDAVHPGYGFLSENADFAEACARAGVTSKTDARKLAIAAGAPVVPGTESAIADLSEARLVARKLGYPVLLKASAGGGGKGMRRVNGENELEAAVRDASSEASRAFNNGAVYLEKLVLEPRHIEIQVLGDQHGHMIHLGERECSIQRRHQKVVEECPSPVMLEYPELRERMGEAALKIARAAGYTNAGTVEFLVDPERNFYFLEMNTRLQVEHPVTELVTGLDLVHWQLKIAAGERLTLTQKDIRWNGSAIECRIYAEDPDHDFLPSPGRILRLKEPSGPGVRLDSGVYEGWQVPLDYDPLLAKLAAWATDRETAIQRMHRALNEYIIGGIRTNLSFFHEVLDDVRFRNGTLSTAFLDSFFKHRKSQGRDVEEEAVAALVAVLYQKRKPKENSVHQNGDWLRTGRETQLR